jgi:hypothetical protein
MKQNNNIFNKMSTYNIGLSLKTERIITKNDIITMCNLLNSNCKYSNLCDFTPEAICEGGILYNFKDEFDKEWYKSVRLCVNHNRANGNWYTITENVISEWTGNDDIIFQKNTKFTTFLKSFRGAPVFTLDELKIWEECFKQIGIIKIGKYPSKKSLCSNLI